MSARSWSATPYFHSSSSDSQSRTAAKAPRETLGWVAQQRHLCAGNTYRCRHTPAGRRSCPASPGRWRPCRGWAFDLSPHQPNRQPVARDASRRGVTNKFRAFLNDTDVGTHRLENNFRHIFPCISKPRVGAADIGNQRPHIVCTQAPTRGAQRIMVRPLVHSPRARQQGTRAKRNRATRTASRAHVSASRDFGARLLSDAPPQYDMMDGAARRRGRLRPQRRATLHGLAL